MNHAPFSSVRNWTGEPALNVVPKAYIIELEYRSASDGQSTSVCLHSNIYSHWM